MDNTQKPRILYVEDDQGLAAVYAARLKIEGFDVMQAYDGESAVATAPQFKPDLILMDIMMPKLNGYQALEKFRQMPETAGTKVILMSALGQPEDIEKARTLGANDFIVKSQVLIEDILARIRAQLEAGD